MTFLVMGIDAYTVLSVFFPSLFVNVDVVFGFVQAIFPFKSFLQFQMQNPYSTGGNIK